MNEIEKIEENRRRLRAEYKALYDAVSEILFRHDPIGINFGHNTDEYEPEVDTILPRLTQARSSLELRCVIYEEFVRWFGGDTVGVEAHYEEVSQDVWRVYKLFAQAPLSLNRPSMGINTSSYKVVPTSEQSSLILLILDVFSSSNGEHIDLL